MRQSSTQGDISVPFATQGIKQRWVGWQSAPLGRSGAAIVEAEMVDWSGAVPPSRETVVHVLLPGNEPVFATRDLGDGRRDTLVRAGQVCVTPAACPGHWAWRGHIHDLNLVLPEDLLAHTADDAGLAGIPDLMPLARGPREDHVIESLVHLLGRARRGETQLLAEEVDHAVALVACWLLRNAKPTMAPPRGGLSPAASRRVRAYVDANLDENLSVGELAGLVGLSTPYFSHAFRASVGEAPYQYILRRRCRRACELLEGRSSLADVALAVGFATQSHFTTAFRRATGTTPAAWRRSRRH